MDLKKRCKVCNCYLPLEDFSPSIMVQSTGGVTNTCNLCYARKQLVIDPAELRKLQDKRTLLMSTINNLDETIYTIIKGLETQIEEFNGSFNNPEPIKVANIKSPFVQEPVNPITIPTSFTPRYPHVNDLFAAKGVKNPSRYKGERYQELVDFCTGDPNATKRCISCKRPLVYKEYSLNKSSIDDHCSHCKTCHNYIYNFARGIRLRIEDFKVLEASLIKASNKLEAFDIHSRIIQLRTIIKDRIYEYGQNLKYCKQAAKAEGMTTIHKKNNFIPFLSSAFSNYRADFEDHITKFPIPALNTSQQADEKQVASQ